jgi:hypothetical protein
MLQDPAANVALSLTADMASLGRCVCNVSLAAIGILMSVTDLNAGHSISIIMRMICSSMRDYQQHHKPASICLGPNSDMLLTTLAAPARI